MKQSLSKFAVIVFVLAGFISLASRGTAFAKPVVSDNELELSGGFFHARGSDTGALNVDVSYGYYLTPGWEAGLRQALNVNFIEGARDVWTGTTAPYLRYHLAVAGNVVPFVGGFLGLAWNDRDATGTLGPNLGAKFFLTNRPTPRPRIDMSGFSIPFARPRAIGARQTMC